MIPDIQVSSVDEFDDIGRDQGWDVEYRQLQRGGFCGRMRALDVPSGLVSYEEVTGPIDVRSAEPEGSIALFMPVCPMGQVRLNGHLANGRQAFLLSSGVEIQIVASTDVSCHIVRASQEQFEHVEAEFGPTQPLQRAEARLVELAEDTSNAIRMAADDMLSLDQRAIGSAESDLAHLVEFIAPLVLTQDGDSASRHSDLKVFSLALEFIDANYPYSFGIADLCAAAGTQIRTLERLFK